MAAAQAGRAAAFSLIAKKYFPGRDPVRFNQGKEIVEFGYDLAYRCEMPVDVRICSIRGSLGWPCIDKTQENMEVCFDTYSEAFGATVAAIWRKHAAAVTLDDVISRFNEGFASATRIIYWNHATQREPFDQFDPHLRPMFQFTQKWHFALWALDEQYAGLDRIQSLIASYARNAAAGV